MNKFRVILIGLILWVQFGSGQNNAQLKEINTQIWEQFSKAFQELDYELFRSIHADDFLRVNGNADILRNKEEYLSQYLESWKDPNKKLNIQFRFFERIANDSYASERGIYKMTVNQGTADKQDYYGKFHVILRKEKGLWKLMVDYDSNEGNTIGEADYKRAFDQNDLDSY